MILDFDRLMYPHLPEGRSQPYNLDKIRQAYRKTFLSDSGRVVLADIAQRGLLHTVSFTGTAPGTDFNEGKRALALEIVQLLNPNPIHNIIGEPNDGTNEFN